MKSNALFFAVLSVLLSLSAEAQERRLSEILVIAPTHVFAPPGFDNNDNAQLVIAGELLNTCFKAAPPEVRVDTDKKRVTIRNRAYHFEGCWCHFILVPFVHTIDLGLLSEGTYEVIAEDSDGSIKKFQDLTIARATAQTADEVQYAHTESVSLESDPKDGEVTLILEGRMASRCFRMKEVKVLYRSAGVIEVLPILEMRSNPTTCVSTEIQRTRVKVSSPWRGKALIHVRSGNGQSVNRVLEF
jgi:hypothetical protein